MKTIELIILISNCIVDLVLLIIAIVMIADYYRLSNELKKKKEELRELEKEVAFKLQLREKRELYRRHIF